MPEIAENDQFKRMSAAHGVFATWVELFKWLNEDANGGFMIPHETMSEATIAMNSLHKYMDLSLCLQLLEDVRASRAARRWGRGMGRLRTGIVQWGMEVQKWVG